MMRKLLYIIEVMLFLWIIVFMHNYYDSSKYITTFLFDLTNYPSVRTLLNIIILGVIFFRITRLAAYWDNQKLKVQTDYILWIIFVLCTMPDIWLYTEWVFYTNTYWLSLFIWVLPIFIWLVNIRLYQLNQVEKVEIYGHLDNKKDQTL